MPQTGSENRARVVFDATHEYKRELKILSAKLGMPINQVIFDALQEKYGLEPPKKE